jgi:hypothetical protein
MTIFAELCERLDAAWAARQRAAHFVTVVSAHARSKRLALNGWWTCADSPTIGRIPDPPGERGFDAAGYGPPLEYVDSAAKIIVI